MVKSISILGSTGSIGTQALDVAELLGIKVHALTVNKRIDILEQQIRRFSPKVVAVTDEESAGQLKIKIADLDTKILVGENGLCEVASMEEPEMVLNSVVGMVGLLPTLAAINAKKDIALANKETLVTGGKLVMEAARKNGVKILPVDSEHSAIFQCLQGMNNKSELKRIILTASGGPFFGKTIDELKNVTREQALKHPNWSMGAKITIDSATMMNKGLEIIEASWLFDMPNELIDVVVHRESVIHSLIEYNDNSVIAQLGVPDMRIPIQYAVTYPERVKSNVKQLNLTDFSKLTFFEPDEKTFKCLALCRKALSEGGLKTVAANGANEQAVALFLQDKISFLDIPNLVERAMDNQKKCDGFTCDDVLAADKAAREFVLTLSK